MRYDTEAPVEEGASHREDVRQRLFWSGIGGIPGELEGVSHSLTCRFIQSGYLSLVGDATLDDVLAKSVNRVILTQAGDFILRPV